MIVLAAGCSGAKPPGQATHLQLVGDSDLDGLLLSAQQADTVMSTTGMRPHPTVTTMGDHRNLLPNLNCLGVWQVDEAAIYGDRWAAMRQQLLRSPDNDNWDNLVVQSVVAYASEQDARDFYRKSGDRWSKCAEHNVNIKLNGQPLPKWHSGALSETNSELTIPVTRGTGNQTRGCQRVLAVEVNVIIDVQACKPASSDVTQASAVADTIKQALHG